MSYRDYDKLKKAFERLEIIQKVAVLFDPSIDFTSVQKSVKVLRDQQYNKIKEILEEMVIKLDKKNEKEVKDDG